MRTEEESGKMLLLSFNNKCVKSLEKSFKKKSHIMNADLGET